MDTVGVFIRDLGAYFTLEKIMILMRLVFLVFVGMPLIYFFSRWLKKYVSGKYSAQQGMIAEKIILYSGFAVIIISVLNDFGFKLTHLLGAAGIVGIAVGFAAQTSISNIISGFFLIGEKPFEIHDVIKIGNTTGVVLSIDMMSVKLRTFDNRLVRIPNETLIKSEFTNITKFPIRRVDLNIGVAYKENISKVKNILLEIAHSNPICLNDPEPVIIISGFGNSSVDILFGAWALKNDWLQLKNSMTEEIKTRFDEACIEIPFPHITLYSGSATEPFPIKIIKNETQGR